MKLGERLGFDVFLLLLFLAAGIIAISFAPTARLIPLAVSIIAAVLMLVLSVIEIRTPSVGVESPNKDGGDATTETKTEAAKETETEWTGPLLSFVWLAGFIFLIWLIGYLIATPIYCLAYMILAGRVRWTTAVAVTAGVWVCAYLLLSVVLKI